MNTTNKVAWIVFALLAIAIGLYPLTYFFIDREFGLLASKSDVVLSNVLWNVGFYGHILFGGLALLIGWTQFHKNWRKKYLQRHRNIGKVYTAAALISGGCGVYIAFYATGGLISMLGFLCLGVFWVFTTVKAYTAIRKKDILVHQAFMIYSYAACFAAVTLRIWLPLLSIAFGEFITAYRIVAWLCWVPNVVFAYFWIRRKGLILG